MPDRNVEGDYRYGYQGQEKDPETGKEAFELRLWDARIGRWLTTDPYGQYSSPYLGMGNDPINGIDPDGGYRTKLGAFFGWVGNGFRGSISRNDNAATPFHKFAIHSTENSGGTTYFSIDFGSGTRSDSEASGYHYDKGIVAFHINVIGEPNSYVKFDNWTKRQDAATRFAVGATYGTAENIYTIFSGGSKFSGEQLQGDHRVEAGILGGVDAISLGLGKFARGLKFADEVVSTPQLWNNFQKGSAGVYGSRRAAATSYKIQINTVNSQVRNHNSFVKTLKDINNVLQPTLLDINLVNSINK